MKAPHPQYQIRVGRDRVAVPDARTVLMDVHPSSRRSTNPAPVPYRCRRPVERWTVDDIRAVIDVARARMPASDIHGDGPLPGDLVGVADRYQDDRRLTRVHFWVYGYITEQVFTLCVYTRGRWCGQIWLRATPPAVALLPIITSANRYCNISVEFNKRALDARARRRRQAEEDAARTALQPPRRRLTRRERAGLGGAR